MKRFVLVIALGFSMSTSSLSQLNCADLEKRFEQVRVDPLGGDNWTAVEPSLGEPTLTHQANGRISSALYRFEECQAEFFINPEGKIYSKRFRPVEPVASPLPSVPARAAQTSQRPDVSPEMAEKIRNIDSAIRQLKAQIASLEQMVQALRKEAGVRRNAPVNNNGRNNRNRNNAATPNGKTSQP